MASSLGDGTGVLPFAVLPLRVGASLEQEYAEGQGAFYGGEHEKRPAVLVAEVRVEVLFEGGAETGLIATLDEVLGGSVGEGHGYSASCCGLLPKSSPK